jgi:hypothetical protein
MRIFHELHKPLHRSSCFDPHGYERNIAIPDCAFVFALFALGHTYGFLSLRTAAAEACTVFNAMNTVHFEFGGWSFSYGGFYRGFGLSGMVSMVVDPSAQEVRYS